MKNLHILLFVFIHTVSYSITKKVHIHFYKKSPRCLALKQSLCCNPIPAPYKTSFDLDVELNGLVDLRGKERITYSKLINLVKSVLLNCEGVNFELDERWYAFIVDNKIPEYEDLYVDNINCVAVKEL